MAKVSKIGENLMKSAERGQGRPWLTLVENPMSWFAMHPMLIAWETRGLAPSNYKDPIIV
jgi:hypothetical protein